MPAGILADGKRPATKERLGLPNQYMILPGEIQS